MEELETRLRRWADADLIDPAQVEAILRHERAEPAGDPCPIAAGDLRRERAEPAPTSGRDLSRLAEAVGYLGGVLVVVGIIVVLGEFWDQLQTWAHLLILGTAAVLLACAAWWAGRIVGAAPSRLASVLWVLSVVMVAIFAVVFTIEVLRIEDELGGIIVSAPTAAYATAIWVLRRRSLEQVAAFTALFALLLSLLAQVPRIEPEAFALYSWSFGLVWLLLAWAGPVEPRRVGYALGALVALGGAQGLTVAATTSGQILGLATAGGLLAVSLPLGSVVLLAIGVVGSFGFITQIVFTHFAETLGLPLVLFTVGALLIGGALLIVRLRPVVASTRQEPS